MKMFTTRFTRMNEAKIIVLSNKNLCRGLISRTVTDATSKSSKPVKTYQSTDGRVFTNCTIAGIHQKHLNALKKMR